MYKYNLAIFLIAFVCNTNGQRTKDKMYEPINGISACFRRLNGTHQIGCSSNRDGSTGIVHLVETASDLDFVLSLEDNGLDYIPAIPVNLFRKETNDKLLRVSHISGLLIYDTNETLDHYSHDLKCPNEGSNIPGTCNHNWNQWGSALLMEDFRLPVFYLNNEREIEKVRTCFRKFNNYSFHEHSQRSLCSIELQSFMFAAYDTPTCLRRSHSAVNMNPVKFCDPLGDQNVWSSLFPTGNSSNFHTTIRSDIKHILVIARMDTTSLFHNLEPGAQSSVTGLVTLLTVAELLKRMLPNYENYDRNVMFVVLNGESFDYIGSQRLVYDIEHDAFPQKEFQNSDEHVMPVRMEDIEMIFELNQIVKPRSGEKLHLHMMNETEHLNFLNILKKNLDFSRNVGTIPPTSIQSFVKVKQSPPRALVLTAYDKYFTNPFYNSIYDNVANINFTYLNMSDNTVPSDSLQMYIGNIAEGLAKSLHEVVTKSQYTGEQRANYYYVNELLHCYLEDANCSIHRAVRRGSFQPSPLNLYVGVTVSPNVISNLLALTFAFFMGDKVGEGACPSLEPSHVFYHVNMSDSVVNRTVMRCYRVSMNLTDAESPAFLIDNYDWTSGEYSTWTESVWREFNVRLFLKPARAHEIMTIIVGIIVFIISFCMVLFVNSRKDVLFGEIATSTPPTNC